MSVSGQINKWGASRVAVASVMTMAIGAGAAAADYPGALWSVERLEVKASADGPALTQTVQGALRRANEVYFFGERPVRMVATVTGAGTMEVSVIDTLTGAPLLEGASIAFTDDGAGIEASVLAWMDELTCTSTGCGQPQPTMLAATSVVAPEADRKVAAVATPVSPAAKLTAPAWPQQITGVLARAETMGTAQGAIPGQSIIPAARPGAGPTPDLDGLRSMAIARNPDTDLNALAPPVRISRFDTSGLGPISYGAEDQLIIGEPRALAPATQTLPQPQASPRASTAVGRWFDSLASLFGFGAPAKPAPAPTVLAAAPAAQTATGGYVQQGTPLLPAERWRLDPEPARAGQSSESLRVASLGSDTVGTSTSLPAPAAASADARSADVPGYPGLRRVPSPGLGLPQRLDESLDAPVVTPIRVASAGAAAAAGGVPRDLSVRIAPEVFGRYSVASAEQLFGGYGQPNAKVRLVTADSATGPANTQSVEQILSSRGLALDAANYAKAERIFWSGETGSRGFWISLPRIAPSSFVLVASAKGSVIANVYPRGSAIQVSDGVAKALGLDSGSWSDVQIIALRQLDRSAARTTGTTTQ